MKTPLSEVGESITLTIVDPPAQCAERRPRTAAHCERPPGHIEEHIGRDTAGRWHTWRQT